MRISIIYVYIYIYIGAMKKYPFTLTVCAHIYISVWEKVIYDGCKAFEVQSIE